MQWGRWLAASALVLAGAAAAQDARPRYGKTIADSPAPRWPQPVRAPTNAPNILIIMTDDVGFGSASAFGGPVPTPAFDALAQRGLRYNRFHTTAICSPTRASLLTGRYPQNVGIGYPTNWASGYEGYNSAIPKTAGALPRILRDQGYSTAMFGKGHITPEWETGPNGPFDRWPTGLGFDHFYGFLGADTSAFEPSLIADTRPVTGPHGPDYHLEADLADKAIDWIAEQRATTPDKPFFAYFAPGAAHAPNHAPADWMARFRGRFDDGWDVMRAEIVARQKALGVIPANVQDAPRPETLPHWDALPENRKRFHARMMEAYAASLSYADHQIGRVIASLKETGADRNTIIIYIQGDNGASAEGGLNGKLFEQSSLAGVTENPDEAEARINSIGGPLAYNLNTGGWGWAMNAPFPWSKRYASHLGGIRNGMVIDWPGHIPDPGGLRSQFLHVSDIMPTLLELIGIASPTSIDGIRQQRIDGISAAVTLKSATAPSPRRTLVTGVAQNLALYQNGWMASTVPAVTPWDKAPKPVPHPDARRWELYRLDDDFSQSTDLAAQQPKRLAAMIRLFWREAPKAGILPIHTSEGQQAGRPDPNRDRREFLYTRPMAQLSETVAPAIVGRSFRIRAEIDVMEAAQGALVAQGGRFGGYALLIDRGHPVFTYVLTPTYTTRIAAPAPLATGPHVIELDFALDREAAGSAATVRLIVDGQTVSHGRVPQSFARIVSHSEGFDVGQDLVSPVDAAYSSDKSRFSGVLNRLLIRFNR